MSELNTTAETHPGWLLTMSSGHPYEWHRHNPARHTSIDAIWTDLVPDPALRATRLARGWTITPGPATALYPPAMPVAATA